MAGQQSQDEASSSDQEGQLSLHAATKRLSPKPIMATIFIEGKKITIEVDTGAWIIILSQGTWRSFFQVCQ